MLNAFFEVFTTLGGIISLFTLVILEIVLGIDNIIFIAIICGYISNKKEQQRARFIGLTMALVVRVILLSTISFITKLVDPFFMLGDHPITGRGLILFGGGVFLIFKTVYLPVHNPKKCTIF